MGLIPPYQRTASPSVTLSGQARAYTFDAQSRLVVAFNMGLAGSFLHDVARLDNGTWTLLASGLTGRITSLAYSRSGDLYTDYEVVDPAGAVTPVGTRPNLALTHTESDAGTIACTYAPMGINQPSTSITCTNATTGTSATAVIYGGAASIGGYRVRPDGKVYVLRDKGTLGSPTGRLFGGAFLFDPATGSTSAYAGDYGNGLVGGKVRAFVPQPDGSMVALGTFTHGSDRLLSGAGRWTGTRWETMGEGLKQTTDNVAGVVTSAGLAVVGVGGSGSAVFSMGLWNGTAWVPLPLATDTGTRPTAADATVVAADGDDLVVGGSFRLSPTSSLLGLLRRTSAGAWSALPVLPSTLGRIHALAVEAGRVVVMATLLENTASTTGLYVLDPGAAAWRRIAPTLSLTPAYDFVPARLLFHRGSLVVAGWVRLPGESSSRQIAVVDVATGAASPLPGLSNTGGFPPLALSRPEGLYVANVAITALPQQSLQFHMLGRYDGTSWTALDTAIVSPGWTPRVLGATAEAFWMGGFDAADGRPCGGYTSVGVCRYVPDGKAVAVEDDERPVLPDPALRAFPHPFAERTTLAFTLDAPGAVRLTVYDLLGRAVATLVDAPLPAGEHRAVLDGAGLAAGLYVAVLDTPVGRVTRRLVRQ